jgi:hypothetical protein
MATPFGPVLIGEAEKTLDAVLRRFLDGTGLTEAQWVTLRLADLLDGTVTGRDELVAAVADRAHFPDAAAIVATLHERGLLEGGRLSPSGRDLVATVQGRIAAGTATIWRDLPADDVAAATRVLNEVVTRARVLLTSSGPG